MRALLLTLLAALCAFAQKVTVEFDPAVDFTRYKTFAIRDGQLNSRSPAGWRGLGTRVVRVPHMEGNLVLDLRDPATRSLVWRAIASEKSSDPRKIQSKLDDMVKKSLAKYPPKR
jgi:hypothetical protein